ncbi:hypothetical protein HYV69_03435 [Candidatus Uhrbacteria bacterium]|nr:hypothetical protein [Candidatus Uhrbacteria bacterium]
MENCVQGFSQQPTAEPGIEEDNPTPPQRLIIVPDLDDVAWAHLHTIRSTFTLQDLPQPLRRRLSPLIGVLRRCNIPRATFDLMDPHELKVVQPKESQHVFRSRNSIAHQESLELTLWWMNYLFRLQVSRARRKQSAKPIRSYWLCAECNTEVSSERDWCTTRNCTSWDLLVECSGVEKRAPLPGIT